jgi:hypothetical protein
MEAGMAGHVAHMLEMHNMSETRVGTGKPEETNNRVTKMYIKLIFKRQCLKLWTEFFWLKMGSTKYRFSTESPDLNCF